MNPEGYIPSEEEIAKAESQMTSSKENTSRKRNQLYEKIKDKETLGADVDLEFVPGDALKGNNKPRIIGTIKGHKVDMFKQNDIVNAIIDGSSVIDLGLAGQLWDKYEGAAFLVAQDKKNIEKMNTPDGIALDLLG